MHKLSNTVGLSFILFNLSVVFDSYNMLIADELKGAAVKKGVNTHSEDATAIAIKSTKTPTAPAVDFCQNVNKYFKAYGWNKIVCNPNTWKVSPGFITKNQNPLLYQEFGNTSSENVTLFFCGVHGDEIPSVYQCFHLARDILFDNPESYKDAKIIIAPIVNPDGFLTSRPTRPNANGVDLNRNFPTADFEEKAIAEWKHKYSSNKRRFPGQVAGSEPETQFQIQLISEFKPNKIVSIHSPLGFIDVDSPSQTGDDDDFDGYDFSRFIEKSNDMALIMSRKSNNFKVMKFRIYPGSLGNYAAHERGIPTFTLELENSDPHKGLAFWLRMRGALTAAIQYELKKEKLKM